MSRPAASSFARFCLFGAVGFGIDAGILTLLVNGFGRDHYTARAISFAAAVTATWLLNRTWTFRRTADAGTEYRRYFSIQLVGALINLGTYVAVIEMLPRLATVPVIPLAVGAGLALVFNFLASRRFVFGEPLAADAQTRSVMPTSSYSGRENLEAMKFARRYNRYLEELVLQSAPGQSALDFGAGAGTFAIPLARAGFDVACVEPDTELRQLLERENLPCHAALDSIPPGSVEYIYSLNVLEHIEDDAAMLDALAARLKPGGKLLLYVPAFEALYSSMDASVGHFRRYRMDRLGSLVEASGLRVEKARYVDCLGFLASLVFKWIGNASGTISPRSVQLYDSLAFPLSRLGDAVFGRLVGKNLLVIATKPALT